MFCMLLNVPIPVEEERRGDGEGRPLQGPERSVDELTIGARIQSEYAEYRRATNVKIMVLKDVIQQKATHGVCEKGADSHRCIYVRFRLLKRREFDI